MGDRPLLILLNIMIICSMSFSNGFGCMVTKNGSAA
jgi:hypothetical protein